MNCVEPIKSIEDINKIKNILVNSNIRDYLFFILGINTGMKVCDILKLKFSDVLNEDYSVKKYITINKFNYYINESIKKAINLLICNYNEHDLNIYIFKSRKSIKPINRSQAYRILSKAAISAGLKYNIGTQTLRKTYGYHFYNTYKDIFYLQKLFNHASINVTFDFIGVKLNLENKYEDFNL